MLGQSLYLARRYPEAEEQLHRTIDLDPNYWLPQTDLALTLLQAGKPKDAIAVAESARKVEPLIDWSTAMLAWTHAAAGDRAAAEKLVGELASKASHGWVPAYALAIGHLGLGDKARAIAELEKAYDERSWFLAYLKVDPEFDSLRSEPRFQALLRRMKFPE